MNLTKQTMGEWEKYAYFEVDNLKQKKNCPVCIWWHRRGTAVFKLLQGEYMKNGYRKQRKPADNVTKIAADE